ncbi:MAG TPA: AarF/UbiB family protein [Syntrophorhabdaceae bacterium]|nr:AarF/UbiB family protein [Syntrophorhabdaceae bacterium]
MPIFRARETYRDLKRYSQIASVLAHHGFTEVLDRLKARYRAPRKRKPLIKERVAEGPPIPVRLRLVFEELGPTFIKLGQILSSRPDILPPDYIKELSKLQDDVPPFPFEEARTLLETQLRHPLRELFSSFEEKPVAAASLAQVHRARTPAGEEVAVKIQRIGIEEVIETDIRILREFAGLAERHVPESRYFGPLELVEGFARTIRHELDFVREGRNIDRFKAHFISTPTVYIPKVHWDLTSSKVLTIEFITGIKISDVDRLTAAGLDRKTIALNGANLTLEEIFELRRFHADPHPGNIFVLDNNVIAPVDFGMTGTIDEETSEQMTGIFVAVMQKDVDTLVGLLRTIGIVGEPYDDRAFKRELHDLFDRYYGVPLNRLDIGTITRELMTIVHRHKLRLPSEFAMIGKALLISEGVGRLLDPEFNIIETARPYARRILLRRFDPARQLRGLSRVADEVIALLRALPADTREILTMMRKGKLAMRFEHRGLELLTDELDRSSNRISFALVIAALIIGSSLIFQTGVGPTVFGYPVLGLGGFLLASILGVWLLIGIMRSKRL